MRYLAIVLCVAAIAAPAAYAKGRISITVGDSSPRVGQQFTVRVRTGWIVPPNDWLRLIAVAPGKDWYQVVGTVTGDSSRTHANLPPRRLRDHTRPRRPAELARPRQAAAPGPLAPRDPQRNAPRIHGAATDRLDALGASSSLIRRCGS